MRFEHSDLNCSSDRVELPLGEQMSQEAQTDEQGEFVAHPFFDRPTPYPARDAGNPYTREAMRRTYSEAAVRRTSRSSGWDRIMAGRHFEEPGSTAFAGAATESGEPASPPMSRVTITTSKNVTPVKSRIMQASIRAARRAARKGTGKRGGKRARSLFKMQDVGDNVVMPSSKATTKPKFLAAPIVIIRTQEEDGTIKEREFKCEALFDFAEHAKLRAAVVKAAVNDRSVKGKAQRKKRRKHHKDIKNPPTPTKEIQLKLRRGHASAPQTRKSVTHFFGDSYDYALRKLGFSEQFVDSIKLKYKELVTRLEQNNLRGHDVEELLHHHEVQRYLKDKGIDAEHLNDHDKFMIVLHFVQSREVLHMVANSIRHRDENFMNGSRLENSVMIFAEHFIRQLNKQFPVKIISSTEFRMDLEAGREGHVSYLPKGAISIQCQIVGSLTSFEFKIPVDAILKPVLPVGFAHQFIKLVTEPYIQEYQEGVRCATPASSQDDGMASPMPARLDEQADDDAASKGEEGVDSSLSSSSSSEAMLSFSPTC